ncbi:MAG: SDR family oxidoreductase [Bacteroidales bacterium]
MTILVTGATGLIGGKLALHLADQGVKVHALCRSAAKAAGLSHPNITIFHGTIEDERALTLAMEGCEQVYHLAAYTGVWRRDSGYYTRINVDATHRVLQLATAAGVRRVVITSTAGVLGPSGNGTIDEESQAPASYFTYYEESKARMEEMICAFPKGPIEIVIVNPSRLYGPGPLNKSNSVTKLLVQYLRGKWHFLPGNGNGRGNYAFLEDVVQGHILAMEKGIDRQRYILGGENLSYKELFQRAGKVAGCTRTMIPFPNSLMLTTAALTKIFATLTGTPPLITPGWVRKYYHDWNLSCRKAERELGYRITPFEEGVEKIIKTFDLCRK